MDKAREITDKKLKQMERKVSKIYSEAYEDISKKWNAYMKSHAPKVEGALNELHDAIKSGDKDRVKEAQENYARTVKNVTVNDERFRNMRDDVISKINHTNEIALDYLNGNMASIYTINYNAFGTEKVAGYSFALVNEQAVKELATNNKLLLPTKKLNVSKDKAWNKKLINSQILQGVLQGESIPKMAKRLMTVTDMNRKSAIRNARTMTTSAENKGRQDSFKKAEKDGVIMTRTWVAAHDSNTRAWHIDLHGVEVGVDEPWENEYGEIMYPGDPTADPANVYNCRCSIRAHIKGFKWNEKKKEEPKKTETKRMKSKAATKNKNVDKNGLTLKEQAEIMSYKSFDYYVINDTLRKKGFGGLDEIQKEKVRTLDSALSKLPTYSGDISRSLYFNDEESLNDYIQGVQKSGKLDSPAYLSATKNTEELYNPEGQVQIYINNSNKARDLKGYDNGEQEVLYERNSKIDIIEQSWKDGVYTIIGKERGE